MIVRLVILVFRFKNVHKRKAEQEQARLDEEENLDEFTSPRHQSFSGDSDFAPVPGGSGRSRVGFLNEVPTPPRQKSSRREGSFSYQIRPQVKTVLHFLPTEKTCVSPVLLNCVDILCGWFAGEDS